MSKLLVIYEFLKMLLAALLLAVICFTAFMVLAFFMYISLLDDIYSEFKFKTRKKVDNEQ